MEVNLEELFFQIVRKAYEESPCLGLSGVEVGTRNPPKTDPTMVMKMGCILAPILDHFGLTFGSKLGSTIKFKTDLKWIKNWCSEKNPIQGAEIYRGA